VRLKANGNLDLAFNCGDANNGVFNKVVLQSTGKIILIGKFNAYLSTPVSSIVRLLSNGNVDNTFSCNLAPYNNVVVLTNIFMQSDDQISIPRNDAYPQSFSKYSSDGALISDYPFLMNVTSILLANGNFLTSPNIGNNEILLNEYSPKGSLVHNYSSSGWFAPYDFSNSPPLLFSVENEIYMGCNYYETYTDLSRKLVRILNTNEIDLHFLPLTGPNFSITDLAKLSTNKYIIIGGFTRIGTAKVNTIAMIDSSCIVNPSFNSGVGFNGPALCVLVQGDGKIIVGGDFTAYNNQPAPKIIRLNQDGSIDPSFNVGSGFDFPVYDMEIINSDKILVAGVFGTYQSTDVSNLICLNKDGSMNTSFNTNIGSGSNGRIRKIRKEDNNIYLIGDFNYFNGNLSKHIVRIDYAGVYDHTFNAGQGDNGKLNDALEYEGKLYVTGNFSTYNNVSIHSLAKLNLDGTSVSGFYEPPYIGSSNIPGINVELVGKALVLGAAQSTLDNPSSYVGIPTTSYSAYSYGIEGDNLSVQGLFNGDLSYLPPFSADSSDYYLKHLKIVKTDNEIFMLGISTLNIGAYSANFIGRYKIGSSNISTVTTAIDPSSVSPTHNNLLLLISNGQMMIRDNNNSKGILKIVDLNGKEVFSQESYQTNTEVNINAINTGMYIIKYVSTDQNNKVFKVIFN
jgi:uncharacterized delta-60 repeat protein